MRSAWGKVLSNLLVSQLLLTAGLLLLDRGVVGPTPAYAQGCPECEGVAHPECGVEGGTSGNWSCCQGVWINLDYQCCDCGGAATYCPAP